MIRLWNWCLRRKRRGDIPVTPRLLFKLAYRQNPLARPTRAREEIDYVLTAGESVAHSQTINERFLGNGIDICELFAIYDTVYIQSCMGTGS